MGNHFKDNDIKNRPYYFFDDMINVKNYDLKKIKTDKKSNKNILIDYIGYATVKDLRYIILYTSSIKQMVLLRNQ